MEHWKRRAGLFILGQFLSTFGSMLVQHAITWQITLETRSGLMMTLFTWAALLPMVLVSPAAGVMADRYDRKKLIVISDGAIAALTLVLALLYGAGRRSLWLMLAVSAARSLGQGIQQPAVNAVVPQIVPPEHLQRFNGIQGTIQSLNMFTSPMAAGALLSVLPIEKIFLIDVATAVLGILTLLCFVDVPKLDRVRQAQAGLRAWTNDLKEGLRYIGSIPWLKVIIFYSLFFGFFAAPAALLTPLQAARSFGGEVWHLTAIELAFSMGSMLGGVLIAVWGGFRNRAHTIVLACAGFGLTALLMGLIPYFPLYLAVMLLCGVTMPLYHTPMMTILQTELQPGMMGRVFSVMTMLSGLMMPLGMAVFGPLGDAVSVESILIVTGAALLTGGLALLRSGSLMAVGVPTPPSDRA